MIRQLQPRFVERIWGRNSLAPLFGDFKEKIGEVWFAAASEDPLLVKFIFTSERLSVQVHPDDGYARVHEGSAGKTEMWHILAADSGASIALGFRTAIDKSDLRAAISDGSVEQLLNWVPVHAGDTFFAPAGTVHAIGAGLVLCEVQQHSNVTYRLYDYGRPRELHLEKGLDVAATGPFEGRRDLPLTCEHFTTDMIDVREPYVSEIGCDHLLIVTAGAGSLEGTEFRAGDVWQVRAGHGGVRIAPSTGTAKLLRTRCADPSTAGLAERLTEPKVPSRL